LWSGNVEVFKFYATKAASAALKMKDIQTQSLAARAQGVIENSENPAVFEAFIKKLPEPPEKELAEFKLLPLSPSASKDILVANASPKKTELEKPANPTGAAAIKKTISSNEC